MYMYRLNRLRSFFRDGSPNRRASPTHEGIVRSSIPYGVNLDEVAFPSRIDFGSCLSGIGYRNDSLLVPSSGRSASNLCVKYSSLNFGFFVLLSRPSGK